MPQTRKVPILSKLAVALGIAFPLLAPQCGASPGSLVPGFGSGGKTLLNFSIADTYATATAMSGSKVVVAGYAHVGATNDFAVMRFNADGTADQTFGTGGRVTIDFGGEEYAYAVAVQPDGKIVVAGGSAESRFKLARLNTNGSLDTTFGGGTGKVSTLVGTNSTVFSLAIQSNGKIVAAGTSNSQQFALARYNTDGTLDPNFGCGPVTCTGMLTTSFGGSYALARGVAVQPDGKILAGGSAGANALSPDFALARYNANGSLDLATFGCNATTCTGLVTTSIGPGPDEALALVLQPDGKVILGGYARSGSAYDFALARFSTTGQLDPSFGLGGKVTTDIGELDVINAMALQPDGKLVVSGVSRTFSGLRNFAHARYDSSGFLDSDFGCATAGSCSGVTVLPAGPSESEAAGVALRGDGRIVAAGWRMAPGPIAVHEMAVEGLSANGTLDTTWNGSGIVAASAGASADYAFALARILGGGFVAAGTTVFGGVQDMAVARFLDNGAPDTTFATQGRATIDFGGGTDYANAVLVQGDGKVVAAGAGFNVTGFDFAVTRLLANGQPDTSFGIGGRVLTQIGSEHDVAQAALIQPDGRIVLGGSATRDGFVNSDFAMARYNTNGTLDTTFGCPTASCTGKLTTSFGTGLAAINAMARQPDGKIVAVGYATGSPRRIAMARYNANGTIDTSFCIATGSCTGLVVASAGAGNAELHAVKLLPDGSIVAAGFALNAGGFSDILVMKRRPDGTPDTAFGTSGTRIVSASTQSSRAYTLGVDSGGRLVVGGQAWDGTATSTAFVRLHPNGNLDTAFGNGGKAVIPAGTMDSSAEELVILPSGNIVAAGWATEGNATGSVDFLALALDGRAIAYDFNGDAHPDVIWSNTSSGATYVWHMTGPPPALVSDAFIAGIDPSWKVQGIADFNGDGHPDIVWRNTATGNTYVWYMNDASFISDAFVFSLPPEWVIQGVADFNADGKPDFLMRNTGSGVGFVWFFDNATAIGDQFLFGIDPSWKVEQVGDLNHDGQPDLLFRNTGSGLAFAWNTTWSGSTLALGASSAPIFSIDPVWEVVQLEDWNGDGEPDLLFRNASSGVVFVWYMTGTTLAGSDYVIMIDPSWEIVPRR